MLLPRLLDAIDDKVREYRRKKRQEKRNEAADDPGAAMDDHFPDSLSGDDGKK